MNSYSRKQTGRWVSVTISTAENRQGGGYMLLSIQQKTDREVGKCHYPYSRKKTGRWVSVTIPIADNRQGGG